MGEHQHHNTTAVGSRLRLGILVSAIILVVEVVFGLLANSLALLSDAGHVLTDVIALSLSWYGVNQARRPATASMTFGYHRVGVIIAVANAMTIVLVALVIFYEAFRRLGQPPAVNGLLVIPIAIVGLVANVLVALLLARERRQSINVRSAFWHASGDALASVGVIISGTIIALTHQYIADAVISVFIGVVIAFAGWGIIREGLGVLLEASPKHLDVERIAAALKTTPGVLDIHDVHVWSISPEIHALSAHITVADCPTSQADEIRRRLEDRLKGDFGIGHATLQLECAGCTENGLLCRLDDRQEKNGGSHAETDEH